MFVNGQMMIDGPRWLGSDSAPLLPEHPKINVQVRPIGIDLHEEAEDAMLVALGQHKGDPKASLRAMRAFRMALISGGVTAWTGIADKDGKPVPVTPETIRAIMSGCYELAAAIDRLYAAPCLQRWMEKNGYAPSSNGTTGKAGTAARATKAAQAKGRAANAPTKSTNRKPRRAAPSGG